MLVDALSLLLAVTVLLLVASTASLFLPGARSPWSLLRLGTAAGAVAAVALLTVALVGGPVVLGVAAAVVLGGSVAAWAPVQPAWAARGVVAWALGVDAAVLFLLTVGTWTVTAGLAPLPLVAGTLLWVLELFVLAVAAGYAFELVDVLARRRWSREVDLDAVDAVHRPFVSLHVPAHNEPPEMVIATLEALLRLEYDDYEILMVDDNTEDPALWHPVEEFCRRHDRIRFFHLEDWPGYKSGALNFALTQTDPRAELVGVVDADYLVRPDFLARCAPLFADPALSFVQTPQDYRDWKQSAYFRRLYHSYGYFFDVSQRSRSEVDGAIFGGTMGLIRRDHLVAAGGWDEWCITEDAELSLRLLRRGGSGLHVAESFGHGVMPLTFEALKRQRFRWCFGGVQLLRMHWRSLLPWDRSPDNALSTRQRWAYLVGGLQWFGDLGGLLFTGFLLAGAVELVLGQGIVVRRLSGLVLVCLVALLAVGVLRTIALLRRVRGATLAEAVGAFGIWLGLGWAVALAAGRGLVAQEGAFLRTPKVRGELRARDALRGNRAETTLAAACLVAAALVATQSGPAGVAIIALLLWQGAAFAMAPLNSLAAIRAELPSELRRRRRDALPSWTTLGRSGRRLAAPTAVTVGAVLAFVALAAPAGGPLGRDLDDLGALGDRIGDGAGDGAGDGTGDRAGAPGPTSRPEQPAPTPTPRLRGAGDATPEVTTSPAGDTVAVRTTPSPHPDRPTAKPSRSPAAPPTRRPDPAPSVSPSKPGGGTTPTRKPDPAPSQRPTDAPAGGSSGGSSGKAVGKPDHAASGRPTDKPSGRPDGAR